MESLIKVEEFDDVKQLGDEINTLQDQVYELSKCLPKSSSLVKIGKVNAANDLQQAVNDKTSIKASLQALHLKEEQEKLPPEIT